jgi:hypothetical protein
MVRTCIGLKARWVRVGTVHVLTLLRDGCVELLQLARVQSFGTEHIAEIAVVCHMVHRAAAFGACGVESIKSTVAGMFVGAAVTKSVAAGDDDDGIDWVLHTNGTAEFFCRHNSLLNILWDILFAQVNRSSIKSRPHTPSYDHWGRTVRLVHGEWLSTCKSV